MPNGCATSAAIASPCRTSLRSAICYGSRPRQAALRRAAFSRVFWRRKCALICPAERDEAWLGSVDQRSVLNRWLFAGQRDQIRDVYVAGNAVIKEGYHPAQAACAARFSQAMAALR